MKITFDLFTAIAFLLLSLYGVYIFIIEKTSQNFFYILPLAIISQQAFELYRLKNPKESEE